MERIVVGVDGTESSDRALVWALDEAERRGADVEVVTGWAFPALAALPLPAPSVPELIRMARDLQDAALQRAGARPTLAVHHDVVQGHSARVLLDAAEHADLLVLGRGGGPWLGSTSSRCAAHAGCDVVVVP